MASELNLTLFQSFHWYANNDGKFWKEMTDMAPLLKKLGVGFV